MANGKKSNGSQTIFGFVKTPVGLIAVTVVVVTICYIVSPEMVVGWRARAEKCFWEIIFPAAITLGLFCMAWRKMSTGKWFP